MTKFVGLGAKTYSYLIDDNNKIDYLEKNETDILRKTKNNKSILKIQHRF